MWKQNKNTYGMNFPLRTRKKNNFYTVLIFKKKYIEPLKIILYIETTRNDSLKYYEDENSCHMMMMKR